MAGPGRFLGMAVILHTDTNERRRAGENIISRPLSEVNKCYNTERHAVRIVNPTVVRARTNIQFLKCYCRSSLFADV